MIRINPKAKLNNLQMQFAEMYYKCINAEEGCGMSFVALNGDKVTVMNGRRLVIVRSVK